MAEACALEARDVSKQYDGAEQRALSDICLKVQAGEFYSFLGPSGCGKTTMLRIFAGFERATSGEVYVAGRLMNDVPPNKRPVNMVFQSYALFPHLSVLENVAFGLRAAKSVAKADILKKAGEALAIVRLASLGDRLPAQLSGGQQQRVALARALVMRPVVLLLDEPLSALDIQIREEMQDELSRLQKELNITFVMVTHDQSEALALSTSVAVFNQGKIEQIGHPRHIYDSPETAFVARFIGRSNVLSGKLVKRNKNMAQLLLFEGCCLQAQIDDGQPVLPDGAEVELCIKPEAIRLQAENNAPDTVNKLACRLESSAYQGSLADLRLCVLGAPYPLILRATVTAARAATVAGSEKFDVWIDAADIKVLLPGPKSVNLDPATTAGAHVVL